MISPTHGSVDMDCMISIIDAFVKEDVFRKYRIYIGTDSQRHGYNGHPCYVFSTVVAVLRKGNGGIYFYDNKKYSREFSLQEKIFTETSLSLEAAATFMECVKNKGCSFCHESNDIEIHVDVGERGKTKNIVKSVVGMVLGNGFCCKTKPLSFAASKIADKHNK